jgi:hypothetical protein
MSIAVIVATSRPVRGIPDAAEVVALARAEELPRILAAHDAAVIVSDGFDDDTLAGLAAAIRASNTPVIEVRAGPWDGETPSPLSGACRGVISGFGEAGIAAAARLLLNEQH